MWWRSPQSFSRQAIDELWSRGSRCSCHAKRYIPSSRQRKLVSDGGNPRRKPSTKADSVAPDPDELLRELNSGSVGWLRDEEEQDWGLDDVAEHARARQQQQLQRFGGRNVSGPRRHQGSSSSRDETVGETHASPLGSGLASVSVEEEGFDARDRGLVGLPRKSAMSSSSGAAASATGRRATTVPTVTDNGCKHARTTVDMEASYARRNPEIIEALRLRGFVVRVRQPGGGTADDVEDESEGKYGRYMDLDGYGLSDEDDGLDLLLDSDLAVAEDGDDTHGSSSSRSGRSGSSGSDSRSGQDAPSGARTHWYDGLAAAGFSVRTNAVGEVFLERTVRRKAPAGPAATGGVAAAVTTPAAASTAAASPPPQPLIPPLEPISSRPAIVAALQRLITPQQVLDYVELSYSEWAANGYRLVDMRSGRPVAAPNPAEAAHCLRALALTARRTGSGGWRCLELAAGRQAQGLAEALRVTPPRLLPEQATQQVSAAYFDAARGFWLDPSGESILDDPRVSKVRTAANRGRGYVDGKTTAPASGEPSAADDDEEGLSVTAPSSYDPVYDSLVAKYTAISQIQQRHDMARAGRRETEGRQVNGHAVPLAGARTEEKVLAALPAESPSAALPATSHAAAATATATAAKSSSSAAAAAIAEAATRRAAKVECLVSALWAMSSLGGPPYFQAETEAAMTILVRCLASAAAAAAPPLAGSGPAAAAAAASASSAALTCPSGLTGWQAGQVLWALGNSRHVTVRLADLETNILRSGGLSCMQPRDVTRVLWGFASLGYKPERLLLTIRSDWSWRERTAVTVSERQEWRAGRTRKDKTRGKDGKGGAGGDLHGDVRSFTPQQLAGAVWSLAVMEQVDTGPFRSAWAQLLRRAAEVPPSEPALTQIWQANLAIHLEASASSSSTSSNGAASVSTAAVITSSHRAPGRSGGVAAEDLTAAGLAAASSGGGSGAGGGLDTAAARSLLLRSRDLFLAATSALRRKVQSGYQRQIANTLTGLRMMHLLEDNSAGYSIDITLPQLRIALEADGPTHTSRTPGGAVLGATAMKRRHLQRMGWHVVNVTYKVWDKLTSEAARRAFLQERINEALLSRIQVDEGEKEEENGGAGEKDGEEGRRHALREDGGKV